MRLEEGLRRSIADAPHREVGLEGGAVAVLVRVLELVERGVLGVEERSIPAEEVVVDCADVPG